MMAIVLFAQKNKRTYVVFSNVIGSVMQIKDRKKTSVFFLDGSSTFLGYCKTSL